MVYLNLSKLNEKVVKFKKGSLTRHLAFWKANKNPAQRRGLSKGNQGLL